jgi:hypothetical protein
MKSLILTVYRQTKVEKRGVESLKILSIKPSFKWYTARYGSGRSFGSLKILSVLFAGLWRNQESIAILSIAGLPDTWKMGRIEQGAKRKLELRCRF